MTVTSSTSVLQASGAIACAPTAVPDHERTVIFKFDDLVAKRSKRTACARAAVATLWITKDASTRM